MKDRIDPLIAERAPWLHNGSAASRAARTVLDPLLGYRKTLALAMAMDELTGGQIMDAMAARLARRLEVRGLDNIPREGPALIVANHPTGIADGIMLHALLAPIRPDLYTFANYDILRLLPQMDRMIAPVEWRKDRRTHAKTRQTMAYTRQAVAEGRLGVIFPSGRLAKRRGLHLCEREWMPSAAMIARKFDLPVVPLHIRARNSALFYLFDLIHPTLRDITLFHETLNKDRQPYAVTVGRPIAPAQLPARSDAGIEFLRAATLALGDTRRPARSRLGRGRRQMSRSAMGAQP